MKLLSIVLMLVLCSTVAIGQQKYRTLFKKMEAFTSAEQYRTVEKEILEASNFLLSQEIQRRNIAQEYYYANKCVKYWAHHNEDFHILIFGKVVESCRDDVQLVNLYMAAMSKFLIEQAYFKNRRIVPKPVEGIEFADLPEVKETLLESAVIFFDFLENIANETPNKQLFKGIVAKNEGELENYMFR